MDVNRDEFVLLTPRQKVEKLQEQAGRIRELEAKLRMTEGAFKNTRIRELEAKLADTGQIYRDSFKRTLKLEAALTKIASPGINHSPGPDLHECIEIAKAALRKSDADPSNG